MTFRDLSQLRYLRREITIEESRLRELEETYLAAVNRDGMPHAHNPSSPTERLALEIQSIQETIADKIKQCVLERDKIESYIAGIDDSLVRQALTLHFVSGFSWNRTAHVIGGGNTGDSIRMVCARYLDKHG